MKTTYHMEVFVNGAVVCSVTRNSNDTSTLNAVNEYEMLLHEAALEAHSGNGFTDDVTGTFSIDTGV